MDDRDEPTSSPTPNVEVASTTGTADDRRAVPRVAHRRVVMMPFGPGMYDGFEPATLLNCSKRGVGLLLAYPLGLNTRFFLKVRLSTVALAVYTVRHCAETPEGYEIGAEFHGIIGKDVDCDAPHDAVFAALLAE